MVIKKSINKKIKKQQQGIQYLGVHPAASSALSPARTLLFGLRLDHLNTNDVVKCSIVMITAGLDVATCGVANATGFGPLATNISRAVASLATTISTYYFIYIFFFSFPRIHDEMNEC